MLGGVGYVGLAGNYGVEKSMKQHWKGPTWEYKVETYMAGRRDKTAAEAMNIAGEQGWQAYHLIKGKEHYEVWFKREVNAENYR